MSNITLFVRNPAWPVGDHEHISTESLLLLDFMRIEAKARAAMHPVGDITRLDVSVEELVQWQVVRGWRTANYITALES